jgi:hypothetical protein
MAMAGTQPIPSIWSAATRAWADAFHAISRMRGLALVVCLILFLFAMIQWSIATGFVDQPYGSSSYVSAVLTQVVLAAFQAVVLAPFAIAVHRFILLDEVTPRYRLDPGDQRFLRFAFNAVQLALLSRVPGLIGAFIAQRSPILGGLVALVLHIVVAVIMIRVVILFPAVAVDAARPTWRHASQDTSGHSWRVFFVLLVTGLPFALLAAILVGPFLVDAVDRDGLHFGVSSILAALAGSVLATIVTAVLVTVASRLYRVLGTSLG